MIKTNIEEEKENCIEENKTKNTEKNITRLKGEEKENYRVKKEEKMLGQKGQQWLVENYNFERLGDKYLKLLKRVVANQPVAAPEKAETPASEENNNSEPVKHG